MEMRILHERSILTASVSGWSARDELLEGGLLIALYGVYNNIICIMFHR